VNPADFIQGLSASVAQYPLAALLVALVGGALSTSVCPCTLPTGVGILGYVGGNVGGAAAAYAGAGMPNLPLPSRRAPAGPSGAALSLAFFVGLVAALTSMGAAAAAAGSLLTRYDAAFSLVAAAVTGTVGVAALAGPWVRRRLPDPNIRQRGGVAGALVYGVAYSVATITSSAGPLVLVLTVATAMGRPGYGALLSLAFAVGRGLPFLALGIAAGHAGRRLAPWLERLDRGRRTVEIVSGFALIGLAGYFVWLATALR
jgi:cytochrome c-type biogenesis protein